MNVGEKKNKLILKPWTINKLSKWMILSNLLFAYCIVFIILVACVGHKKMHTDEVTGCYVIDSFLFALAISFISFTIYKIFSSSIPKINIDNRLLSSTLCIPLIGAIVNYILIKKILILQKHNSIGKQDKFTKAKEPMSVQVLLVLVTFVVVLIIWLVYAVEGHTTRTEWQYVELPLTIDGHKIYAWEEVAVNNTIPGVVDVLLSPINGFINGAEIIVYLLIMGAFLQAINSSKALEAGIGRLIKKLKGKELIIIPVIMLLFSIGGATFGMCEETIAFYAIVMPIVLAAGFDGITGVIIILFGAGLGVCSSIINPFMIMVSVDAVNKAHIPGIILSPYDGMAFRIIVYVIFLTIGITFITLYAKKIRKDPHKSLVYEYRDLHKKTFEFDSTIIPELTTKRKITLVIFMMSFVMLILGAIPWQDLTHWNGLIDFNDWLIRVFPFLASGMGALGAWYLASFALLFLSGALIISAMHWQGANHFVKECLTGARDFLGVAIVIAIARGLSLMLTSSGFGDMIAKGVAPALKVNDVLGTVILFVAFTVISIFIPSTSGFAYTVFGPIAAPAMASANMPSIASGIASTSIANGLINLSSPTAGPFVIGCQMAKVPLPNFYKLAWKLLLILFLTGLGLLLLTCIPGMPTSIIGK